MTARLADLREPPVVGRLYLVPFVRAWWNGKVADWPVLGPAHTDREFFQFPHRHYHVDARFVSRSAIRGCISASEDIVSAAQRYPLSGKSEWNDTATTFAPPRDAIPRGRPPEKRLRCVRADLPYHFGGQRAIQQLRDKHGGQPCAFIVMTDGRRLCPHRKVDLSSMVPNADGVVTCPLHGLRIRMTAAQDIAA